MSIAPPSHAPQGGPDVVGVVPAAGHATRLASLPGSKEVYPVGGRPMMDHLLDRMELAGARVRVVTRADKLDVVEHSRARGAEVVLGAPPTLAQSIALGARGLPSQAVVLLGFPDSMWEPADAYAALVDRVCEDGFAVALGLFGVGDTSSCDVAALDTEGRVTEIEIRNPRALSRRMWAIAAARAGALAGMERDEWPSERFQALAREGRVAGVHVSDHYVDLGTWPALRAALARHGS